MPQTIRRVIAAHAVFIGIHLEHVLRSMRIMLHRRQRLQQPPAPPVNEQRRADARFDITKALPVL